MWHAKLGQIASSVNGAVQGVLALRGRHRVPIPHLIIAAAAGSPSPALPPPPGIDPDWCDKIGAAKRVREETRQARRGKPATFDMEGPPIRVGS